MSDEPLTFGIDYGTRKVSIAGMRGHTLFTVADVDLGIRRARDIGHSHDVLPMLVGVVDQYLANEHPDLIALESPIVGGTRNLQTTIKLAMVAGAIACYLAEANQPVLLVPPATWKKVAVGSGAATKEDTMAWAERRWPHLPLNDDRADAIGLAFYAHHHLKEEE